MASISISYTNRGGARPPSWLDRGLSLFTTVQPGEAAGALLVGLNAFLVLVTYYVLKTVREALILTEGGAEVKSYSSAAQALVLLFLVPLYSWVTSRLNRVRAVAGVTLFFGANLAAFAVAGSMGIGIGVAFFVWVGIFNVTVIAQFWSFASDAWTEEQGKRLLPVVGMGSSLGAFAGAKLAHPLFQALGPNQILLLAGFALGACVLLTRAADRKLRTTSDAQARIAQAPLNAADGFKMVISNRYLLLIAGFVLLLNLVNTSGEFLLSRLVVEEAHKVAGASLEMRRQFIGQFYAGFFAWSGLAGLVIQFLLVSRIFKFLGVRAALFIVPCIALAGYGLLAMAPALAVLRVAKILENGGDYSLQNSARHALFLRTSREARYNAKAAIDTFFWRAGDLLQAGCVLAGTRLGFGTGDFAALTTGLTIVWMGVVALVYREYGRHREPEPAASPARPARRTQATTVLLRHQRTAA